MPNNVGSTDRIIRIAIGALLVLWPWVGLGLSIIAFSTIHWIAIVIAAILIGTAVFGTCPLYRLIGVNTCKVK